MTNTKLKKILSVILAVVIAFSVVVTLETIDVIPSWSDVFSSLGFSESDDGYADFVRFIDVGQGDSVLIGSNDQTFLIDAGIPESFCFEKILSSGVKRLDVALVTHYHDDHYGGLAPISESLKISNFIIPDYNKTEGNPAEVLTIREKLLNQGANSYIAKQGMNFTVGDFEITVLGYYPESEGENNRSVITMAEIGKYKFLFTGDIESDCEELLISDNIDFKCDVLKVAHHGSSSSTTAKFLNKANPKYAVISCGEGNQYGHPHDETVTRLENSDIKRIYRTDTSGDITFYIEENELRIKTEK